ncbi:hypothetical protein UACE39S_04157 [Ureibacillus acetophenoni]
MRISTQPAVNIQSDSKTVQGQNTQVDKLRKQGSSENATTLQKQPGVSIDKAEISQEKLDKVVNSLNEILKVNNSSAKFIYHEGLERYFVQVVDKNTEEVIKEVPPKKLLECILRNAKTSWNDCR